jgi:hypothetical protein
MQAAFHVPYLKDQQKDGTGHKREKRFFGLIGSLLGLGSLGLGSINTWQISRMKSNMEKVEEQMKNTQHTIEALRDGEVAINNKIDAVKTYLHDEIKHMYKMMERFRCQAQSRISYLEKEIVLVRYRDYLRRNVEAAIQGALSGKLSIKMLSPGQLQHLIKSQVDASLSILADEPTLAYQFGRLYPVRVDMDSMTFAYLLEFPLLTRRDIAPVFKVFNVGFHQSIASTGYGLSETLYKAPLPDYFISRADGELIPLKLEFCTRYPGIMYCEPAAIDREMATNPCLSIFTNKQFEDPHESLETSKPYWKRLVKKLLGDACYRIIKVDASGGQHTQVIMTPAGALIRARTQEIKMYRTDPRTHGSSSKAHVIQHSSSGVYWLPHLDYQYFTINGRLYASKPQHTMYVETKIDPIQGQLVPNWTISSPSPASYQQVVHFDNVFRAQLAKIVTSPTLGIHGNDWNTIVSITLILFWIGVGVFVFIRGRRYLRFRRRGVTKRDEERGVLFDQMVSEVVGRLAVLPPLTLSMLNGVLNPLSPGLTKR